MILHNYEFPMNAKLTC